MLPAGWFLWHTHIAMKTDNVNVNKEQQALLMDHSVTVYP